MSDIPTDIIETGRKLAAEVSEPQIAINGTPLTTAQAMAVRVACSSFFDEMASNPDALGEDKHGRRMTALYTERLGEVIRLMLGEDP